MPLLRGTEGIPANQKIGAIEKLAYRVGISFRDSPIVPLRRSAAKILHTVEVKQEEREHQKAQSILAAEKERFHKILGHDVIPSFVRERLMPLVNTIHLISDEEFTNLTHNSGTLIIKEGGRSDGNRIVFGAAMFIQDPNDSSLDKIRIRESYLRKAKETDDTNHVIAEELGHALISQRAPISLDKFKNVTWVIRPFTSLPEFLSSISNTIDDTQGSPKLITPKDIQIRPLGFMSVYELPKMQKTVFSQPQVMYEETRAAILRTVFTAVELGMSVRPKNDRLRRNTSMELLIGLQSYKDAMQGSIEEQQNLAANAASVDFLYTMLNPFDLNGSVEKIFRMLYENTLHQFMTTVTPLQRKAFDQAVSVITQDYLARIVPIHQH